MKRGRRRTGKRCVSVEASLSFNGLCDEPRDSVASGEQSRCRPRELSGKTVEPHNVAGSLVCLSVCVFAFGVCVAPTGGDA